MGMDSVVPWLHDGLSMLCLHALVLLEKHGTRLQVQFTRLFDSIFDEGTTPIDLAGSRMTCCAAI